MHCHALLAKALILPTFEKVTADHANALYKKCLQGEYPSKDMFPSATSQNHPSLAHCQSQNDDAIRHHTPVEHPECGDHEPGF
jgi:hypothetical protein